MCLSLGVSIWSELFQCAIKTFASKDFCKRSSVHGNNAAIGPVHAHIAWSVQAPAQNVSTQIYDMIPVYCAHRLDYCVLMSGRDGNCLEGGHGAEKRSDEDIRISTALVRLFPRTSLLSTTLAYEQATPRDSRRGERASH